MLYLIFLLSALLSPPPPLFGAAKESSFYLAEDGRNWTLAGRTNAGEATFIPEGEGEENWDEAIILYHLPPTEMPLGDYYQTFMDILNEKSGNLFRSKILAGDKEELLFAWWTDPAQEGAQYGLIKIGKNPRGLQFFRYTTKKIEEVDAVQEKWQEIMKKYDFVATPKGVSIAVDFSLDQRRWKPLDSSKEKQKFYLEGEDESNWSEKFSIDIFSSKGLSPYTFYYKTIEKIEAERGGEVDSKILHADEESITFQWETPTDGGGKELSTCKMTLLNSDLATAMRYTSKNAKNSSQERIGVWEEIVKESHAEITYDYSLVPHEKKY